MEFFLSYIQTWAVLVPSLALLTVLRVSTLASVVLVIRWLGLSVDMVSDVFLLVTLFAINADCQDGDVRLMGGSKATEGTVEVCFDNIWGQVADSGWGDKDAQLICKLLGFSADGRLCGQNASKLMLFLRFC